jgi:cell division protein FtsZ
METIPQPDTQNGPAKSPLRVKVLGVGNAGTAVIENLAGSGFPTDCLAAVNTDAQSLARSSAAEKFHLESRLLRGLGTGSDPERGRALAEEHQAKLKSLCEKAEVVFIVAGLGGGTGTGISPMLASIAKELGALVVAFVVTPFDCEGSRRRSVAEQGLESLAEAADGLVCLPNQKIFKLIDENTSVRDTFRLSNELLGDAIRGVWRLLTHSGLIEIHFADLCALLRDHPGESAFAVAEAMGPTRSREVVDKLLAHPLLDNGELLREASTLLVSITGGSDLAMAEVNRVMEHINAQAQHAQVIMGAAIDERFPDRLAVMLVAKRNTVRRPAREQAHTTQPNDMGVELLDAPSTPRPASRFVPPAPSLPRENMEQLLSRQNTGSRGKKSLPRLRQTQLPLEFVSKGRFDKSEPTIHKGEDLDVPTYIRRGVALN